MPPHASPALARMTVRPSAGPRVVALLAPNPYTAVLRGKNNTSGTGLIEIYDLDPAADSQLANISTRGFVQTQENVMIGGFMLGGNTNSSHVIVRGIGPSLAAAGVTNVLADPTLELVTVPLDMITGVDLLTAPASSPRP